jgi:hypothetical protein
MVDELLTAPLPSHRRKHVVPQADDPIGREPIDDFRSAAAEATSLFRVSHQTIQASSE